MLVAGAAHAQYMDNNSLQPTPSPIFTGIAPNEIFQRTIVPDRVPAVTDKATITLSMSLYRDLAQYRYFRISALNASGVREYLSAGTINVTPMRFSIATGYAQKSVRVHMYNPSYYEIERWDSPAFSVGEVFLVAGQSNAANHGEIKAGVTPTAGVLHRAINPNYTASIPKFGPLTDPMPYATSWGTAVSGSPWMAFANNLSATLQVPVAIVNVAYAGWPVSYFEKYNPNNGFGRLSLGAENVKRLVNSNVRECSFRAVLWHQGESDSLNANSKYAYAASLKSVAQNFRNDTTCTQPWVIARATWMSDLQWNDRSNANKFNSEREVRKAQNYLIARKASGTEPTFLQGPDTDMFVGNTGSLYRNDGSHFTADGLNYHGKLWANRVLGALGYTMSIEKDLLTKNSSGQYVAPEVARVWDLYKSTMKRSDADINLDNEGLRYWTHALTFQPWNYSAIASAFAGTQEVQIYNAYMEVGSVLRAPTFAEKNYWGGVIGTNINGVTMSFADFKNYIKWELPLTAEQKKALALYLNVMGRTTPEVKADMGGLNYWASMVNTYSTEQLSIWMRDSDEFKIRDAFVKAKLRQPSANELNRYMSMMTAANRANPTLIVDAVWTDTSLPDTRPAPTQNLP